MPFVSTSSAGADYATPGEMYRDLPRRPGAVPGLWAHQSLMLTAFTAESDRPDLALELPTGTGKTLTGLLIGEWTRRTKKSRVIYACPTQQLAKQVVASAHKEGIATALLIGRHAEWPLAARTAYEAAEAIAVTTYSSIFNTRPQFADSDLIIFDDAHAGEQYVGESYGVDLARRKYTKEYQAALTAIAPALDGVFLERLREAQPDPSIGNDIRMVLPLRQPGMVEALDGVLGSLTGDLSYRLSMIRAGIKSCLVYVAYSGILVRPYLPPTHQNSFFTQARQRLYLSATLGEGGELERAFGRAGIFRLKQPDESVAPRYGRRFFVFPEFVEDADAEKIAKDIVEMAGKALVLAPDTDTAMADASALARRSWPVWGVEDVADGMGGFAKLDHGTCGLAARYDGLDLPGDACKLVAMDGVPDQDNLQERFLQNRARGGAALASRIRTRVIQGAGRCTRGPEDTAIVLILGADLSRFLSRPEVVDALASELQAEIRFGRENSQAATSAEVLENIGAFLSQDTDETWREQAEPTLTKYRRAMVQAMPEGTKELAASVDNEIRAWGAATIGAWSEAAKFAHEVARAGGHSTKGYRAFWMYLEAAWTDEAAAVANDGPGHAAAQQLVRQSEEVMGLGSWVRQMAPFPTMSASPLVPSDATAVRAIASRLERGVHQAAILKVIGEIHVGLGERTASKYEPALTKLGDLLGASAEKPVGRGRCDSTWCWGNELWLAMEAKSNHEPTGVVPHKDIRQANDQLDLLRADRAATLVPAGSATVVISPKPGIHGDGIKSARPHVHLVPLSAISEIAFDAQSAWETLLAGHAGRAKADLDLFVQETLHRRGVLPSQVRERVTSDPVGALSRSASEEPTESSSEH